MTISAWVWFCMPASSIMGGMVAGSDWVGIFRGRGVGWISLIHAAWAVVVSRRVAARAVAVVGRWGGRSVFGRVCGGFGCVCLCFMARLLLGIWGWAWAVAVV